MGENSRFTARPVRMPRANGGRHPHEALREMVEPVDVPVALSRQEQRGRAIVENACEASKAAVVRPDWWFLVDQRPSWNSSREAPIVAPKQLGIDSGVERAATVGERGDLLRNQAW